jgi:hypothetical protein
MTNDPLRKELEGVEPTPPIGTEDDPINEEPKEPETSPAEGEGDGNDGESGDDRPKENWYREMVRKQEQFQERMQTQFLEAQERMAESFRTAQAPPPDQNGDPLASKTVDELKALRSQVPDEQKAAFEEYLIERTISDRVEEKLGAFTAQHASVSQREQAAQDAVNRFPDLADPTSDFAKAANAKLKKLGKSYINNNPRAVLDVANEVALETGTSFRGPTSRRTNPPGKPASGNQAPAQAQADGADDKARKARLAKIAKKLKAANGGKDFDMKRVEETSKAYNDNIDMFLRK